MAILLRGHHLLCLLGFRGMGYSPEFTVNMKQVYERLRVHPETVICIADGPDDLCRCFPEDQPNHCQSDTVHRRDRTIIEHLGLSFGAELTWKELLLKVQKHVVPGDLDRWCDTCPWLPYGVCKDGVAIIASGDGLPPLPERQE